MEIINKFIVTKIRNNTMFVPETSIKDDTCQIRLITNRTNGLNYGIVYVFSFDRKNSVTEMPNYTCKYWYENSNTDYLCNEIPGGIFKMYRYDGSISHIVTYVDGEKHGAEKWWHLGVMFRRWNNKNDKPDGINIDYYKNGRVENIKNYVNGKCYTIRKADYAKYLTQ